MSKRDSINERRRAALRAYFEARPRQLTAICNAAGVSPETVRAFIKGKNASLTQATYDKLAESEGIPVAVLLGEAEEATVSRSSSYFSEPPSPFFNLGDNLIPVQITGRVQAGLFAEPTDLLPEEHGWTVAPSDSPYRNKPMQGFRVVGDSMNEVYKDGSVLIVVPTIYLDPPWAPQPGQHVIVERKNDWGERELTVKEIDYGPGNPPKELYLVARSTNPAFAKQRWPLPIRHDEDAGEDEKIRIIGLVAHFIGSAPGV